MKLDLSDFKTDKAKKTEGVWVDFGAGAEVKIASNTNADFQKAFADKKAPYDRMNKELTQEQMIDVMTYCMARHLIVGWKNLYEDDEELPFSVENAERVLTEVEWFRDRVIAESAKLSNFVLKAEKEVSKN